MRGKTKKKKGAKRGPKKGSKREPKKVGKRGRKKGQKVKASAKFKGQPYEQWKVISQAARKALKAGCTCTLTIS